jgi:ABC-type sulfate transport system substrate-binding protein
LLENRGFSLLVQAGNPLAVEKLDDIARPGIRVVMASTSEPGARRQYTSALGALLGEKRARSVLSREAVTFPGRLGIQHRDVPQAIATSCADVGIIFHHLARYYATAYPQLFAIVTAPEMQRFSSTIAIAPVVDPLRTRAAFAFSEFFLGVARDVYPRYGFDMISETDFTLN